MEKEIHNRMGIIKGDITQMETDAIVNAANRTLLGGGGVDGAIHRAAGPELLEACRPLGGCPTGEAKITPGFNLPAKYVIHTVGPVYGNSLKDAELLANCYKNSLDLAVRNGIRTIAFPAISCGVYGYPIEEAATVAINTVSEFLRDNRSIQKVWFVLFSQDAYDVYDRLLNEK